MDKQNQFDYLISLVRDIFQQHGIQISMRMARFHAREVYGKGYRKQIEAEWISGNENGQYGYYCTNCRAGFTGENAEWIAKEHDFCPKCGAKMKGE